MTTKEVVIEDDLGHTWTYDYKKEKIIMDQDKSLDGGYFCEPEDAQSLLIEYGYVSTPTPLKVDNWAKGLDLLK